MRNIGFLALSHFCLLLQVTGSMVVRNDITDRCLHIGNLKSGNSETVYATVCSWGRPDKSGTSESYPDEWLEIVQSEVDEGSPDQQGYVIRKFSNTSATCLSVLKDKPSTSNQCSNPESIFAIDIVHQKNFKGFLTSYFSFKIRNMNGKCLTIQPGQPLLKFKECSARQGLFQVWSVCRHNKKCDVDINWSPLHILFPKNNTDIMSGEENIPTKTVDPVPTDMEMVTTAPVEKVAVNEVLYTVQNAMRIYESSNKFLANDIALFYPEESLREAYFNLRNICNSTTLKCYICTQWDNGESYSPNRTVTWIMKWMEECNSLPNSISFLSKDALQVPHHLFPSYVQQKSKSLSLHDKYKLIVPNLRKYLTFLELELQEHGTGATEMKNPESKTKSGPNGLTPGSVTETVNNSFAKEESSTEIYSPKFTDLPENSLNVSQQEGVNSTQDYASIIDIRFFQRVHNDTMRT